VLSVDISPDMGSQSSERRSVSALLFCRQITVLAASLHTSLPCLLALWGAVWLLLYDSTSLHGEDTCLFAGCTGRH
jgi:hypothetical protein